MAKTVKFVNQYKLYKSRGCDSLTLCDISLTRREEYVQANYYELWVCLLCMAVKIEFHIRNDKKRYFAYGVEGKTYRFKWQACIAEKWFMLKRKCKDTLNG